jgi:hypothetical protein
VFGMGDACESTASQNYFLLNQQSEFGKARFSRGSRPGLFSNCSFLSSPADASENSAKSLEKINLEISIRKETLRLIKNSDSKDTYLIEFDYDANVDGLLSIFYLAEEITDASNNTLKFETSYPVEYFVCQESQILIQLKIESQTYFFSRFSQGLGLLKRDSHSTFSKTWMKALMSLLYRIEKLCAMKRCYSKKMHSGTHLEPSKSSILCTHTALIKLRHFF